MTRGKGTAPLWQRRTSLRRSIATFNETHRSGFGDAISSGSFPKQRLALVAKQVYLQEKWPSHIARVYLQLDEEALRDNTLVAYIISIIRAENLGVGTHGVPHSTLARKFAHFTRVSDADLDNAQPTPHNRTLMDWCDMSSLDRPWIESFAVHLACESQVGTMAMIAKGLRVHYNASADDVAYWAVHGGPVEQKHAREGLSILDRFTTATTLDGVLYAYRNSITLLRDFYDSFL